MEKSELRKAGANCPECGEFVGADNMPATVSGWYGNVYYDWAIIGGVRKFTSTKVSCPHCNYVSIIELDEE